MHLEHADEILHAEQILGPQLARLNAPQDIFQLAQPASCLGPGRSVRTGGCIRRRNLSWSKAIRFRRAQAFGLVSDFIRSLRGVNVPGAFGHSLRPELGLLCRLHVHLGQLVRFRNAANLG